MKEPSLKCLKEAAKNVEDSTTAQEKIESLTKAFQLFSRESAKLEQAYVELKKEFKALNTELEDANEKLKVKIRELDAITYYLNSILSNISQGLLFIDLKGKITTYNEAAERILGIPRERVLFKSFHDNFKDSQFGFPMQEILKNLKAPPRSYAVYIKRESERLELEIDTSMMLNKKEDQGFGFESIQGIILLIRDNTEFNRLQQIAQRNDRLKELGEMAAMLAHEIRNPLGGIKGFASLLTRDLKERPELRRMANHIVEGTDHLNTLVTKVLSYARPLKPDIRWTDLNEVVEDLKRHLEVDLQIDPKIKIAIHRYGMPLLAPVDINLIKSALLNLMLNGIQAMPMGGVLTVNLSGNEEIATISVQDNGKGIPPENIPKLYSPFFTTNAEGNGLGLAEVLKIVQAHSAAIDVVSKVGEGSTFTITIPFIRKGAV